MGITLPHQPQSRTQSKRKRRSYPALSCVASVCCFRPLQRSCFTAGSQGPDNGYRSFRTSNIGNPTKDNVDRLIPGAAEPQVTSGEVDALVGHRVDKRNSTVE